ncbi:RNA-directed DNA polymerase [Psychrobacter sp. CAL346-MNA-CIBAN-0220]|uniref:RNA-directed DNA polymerase n=1 Tax=Psychrobacter sp. CAL346-MNA-CIBAN-0220 TaxID=3140457 RepID=UPI00331B4A65
MFSSDEAYEGLLSYGMFSDNLPSFLQSIEFFAWCKTQKESTFQKIDTTPVYYESIRNINIPRIITIPNPVAYRNLCFNLKNNWNDILLHFQTYTDNQDWKISRIHIRKTKENKKILVMGKYDTLRVIFPQVDKDQLFDMGFSNYKEDDNPLLKFKIGAKFQAHADVSNCFGSMYTHSLTWAIAGKVNAKVNRRGSWFNDLDSLLMNTNNGKTHGILIGAHAYNLVSEIILVVVDYHLVKKGYKFIRHIDDYACLTKSYGTAEKFLADLSNELRKYGLILNGKKVSIEDLPATRNPSWVIDISNHPVSLLDYLDYTVMVNYLDFLLSLLKKNDDDATILNYGIKVITGKRASNNAVEYLIDTVHHLVILYPYLVGLLENQLFERYKVTTSTIKNISDNLLIYGAKRNSYELVAYSIYFSLKYDFEFDINSPLLEKVGNLDDCLTLLLAYLYDKRKYGARSRVIKQHKVVAEHLYDNNEDGYWLYYYEVLPSNKLKDYWNKMKKDKISFLKSAFIT